jgi:hypothetical protein
LTADESFELLLARWPAVEDVVRQYGGDPTADLSRDGLVVYLRVMSAERVDEETRRVRDPYLFKLDFTDYDEHAARIWLCAPTDRTKVGIGKEFYPKIAGNGVFGHDSFFCMQGDRRCYEQGHHAEWRLKEHYHPDVVIEYLFELLRSPNYQGRL